MTLNEFELFLAGGALLCAVMVLFSLSRIGSRGPRAVLQAVGFFMFGLGLWALRERTDTIWIAIPITLAFIAILGDALLRLQQPPGDRR